MAKANEDILGIEGHIGKLTKYKRNGKWYWRVSENRKKPHRMHSGEHCPQQNKCILSVATIPSTAISCRSIRSRPSPTFQRTSTTLATPFCCLIWCSATAPYNHPLDISLGRLTIHLLPMRPTPSQHSSPTSPRTRPQKACCCSTCLNSMSSPTNTGPTSSTSPSRPFPSRPIRTSRYHTSEPSDLSTFLPPYSHPTKVHPALLLSSVTSLLIQCSASDSSASSMATHPHNVSLPDAPTMSATPPRKPCRLLPRATRD